jgi:hypothetical protein
VYPLLCPEKSQRLQTLNTALADHVRIIGRLTELAGTKDHSGFRAAVSTARETLKAVQEAREAYYRHVEEHVCK